MLQCSSIFIRFTTIVIPQQLPCSFESYYYQQLLFLTKSHLQSCFYCLGCPSGYTSHPGDIYGHSQIGTTSTETDISGCSQRCNDEADCCSFEYSTSEHYCNLNKDCAPTTSVYKDYNFCVKIECKDHPDYREQWCPSLVRNGYCTHATLEIAGMSVEELCPKSCGVC